MEHDTKLIADGVANPAQVMADNVAKYKAAFRASVRGCSEGGWGGMCFWFVAFLLTVC